MELPGRSLRHLALVRRLGRRPLILAAALAASATALGMAAGSSSDPDRPSERRAAVAVPAEAADADLAWSAAGTVKRAADRHRPRRGGAEHYRRTARRHVTESEAKEFHPLYREAERVYRVNWRLLASIHRQETAFSTAPSTYRGLNPFGCCAGPMQFNVTNGPPSTWKLYRQAYRDGRRPKRYPHRTRSHPSIYDDFDAIMAAGSLLRDLGAGRSLDRYAWHAAYGYYGHDLFGTTYASQVLARAEGWQRDGFCANCPLDEGLVQEFDDAYGEPVREQLLAAERREEEKKREKAKRRRDKKDDRAKRRDRDKDDRERRRSRKRDRRPSKAPSSKKDEERRRRKAPAVRPSPTPAEPAPPPQSAQPPPARECDLVRKLLGCRP